MDGSGVSPRRSLGMRAGRSRALPGYPNLSSLDDFATVGEIQGGLRLGEEGQALVAREILIVGAQEAAGRVHHQRLLLAPQNVNKVFRLDSDNGAGSFDRLDISLIALWLDHESPVTTHAYLEADVTLKERVVSRVAAPPKLMRGRFRASDSLLSFLERL